MSNSVHLTAGFPGIEEGGDGGKQAHRNAPNIVTFADSFTLKVVPLKPSLLGLPLIPHSFHPSLLETVPCFLGSPFCLGWRGKHKTSQLKTHPQHAFACRGDALEAVAAARFKSGLPSFPSNVAIVLVDITSQVTSEWRSSLLAPEFLLSFSNFQFFLSLPMFAPWCSVPWGDIGLLTLDSQVCH